MERDKVNNNFFDRLNVWAHNHPLWHQKRRLKQTLMLLFPNSFKNTKQSEIPPEILEKMSPEGRKKYEDSIK